MDRISVSDLHGYLIDERNAGSLSEIPSTLYEEIRSDMNELRNRAASNGDLFSEGVQSLLRERESLREYLRELYSIRTKKIVALALAKANGEEIDRTDVRMMVPGERMLFDVVCESAESCRKTLLDGKPTLDTTAYNYVLPEVREETASPSLESINESPDKISDEDDASRADYAEPTPTDYRIAAVKVQIPEFQDLSGRIYSLSPGDVVSLPPQMANVLCKDNKALSIRIRK